MKSKKVLIISIAIIIILVVILVLIIIFPKNPVNSPSDSINCNKIAFNGDDKTSILFFTDKRAAENYTKFLLNTSPYKEYKSQFNFYYIDTYTPECEIYDDQAILCRGKELIQNAAACPYDFIISVKDMDDPSLRSSAFQNIISLNLQHPDTVLTHEFGHVFANLADEYVSAEIPKGSKNCVDSCDKFQGEIDGCFTGCSKSNYYRSIENGVMKTLESNTYGLFNERIILEKIDKQSTITGSAIKMPSKNQNDCSKQKYYLIEVYYYKNGTFEIRNITLQQGCTPVNEDEKIAGNFNPKFIFVDSQGRNNLGGTYEYEGSFFIPVPESMLTEEKINELLNIEPSPGIDNSEQTQKVNLESLNRPCKKII